MIIPVVLSGGEGTRLWPFSRRARPKQLLSLTSETSLLQQTVTRLQGWPELTAPWLVCNEEHRFLVLDQLERADCHAELLLLEPDGRNTAPAVALAAWHALSVADDPLLLVLPSDHLIRKPAALREAITRAVPWSAEGWLLTFGIRPERPESGYGYLEIGEPLGEASGDPWVRRVTKFIEKPSREEAAKLGESGRHLWNSGLFLFRASRYREELQRQVPEMAMACQRAVAGATRDGVFWRPERENFLASPSKSIDYAVMEGASRVALVPLAAGWSDVGSWQAVWELGSPDARGNVTTGEVVLTAGTSGSLVMAESRLVATVGVRDLVVVETRDAVLVADRERVQEVREVVGRLVREDRPEATDHPLVFRPWGSYEVVAKADHYQVKRITVRPGGALSLQLHRHRAEHWIVVRGTARVTRGEESFLLAENASTFIPLGVMHRLENPGPDPLEIVEVQSGSYLGEDDIVRFEDDYGRQGGLGS